MPKIIKDEINILEYRKGQAGTIEIYDIVVNSERGQGIGTSLIKELLDKEKPKRLYAFCRRSNHLAHKFYEKLGFKGVEIKNFYEDESAIIYVYETC